MFGFGRRAQDAALAALRAEISDLRQHMRDERTAWSEERRLLIDRMIALVSPLALREARRESAPDRGTAPVPPAERWQANHPGMDDPYPEPVSKPDNAIEKYLELQGIKPDGRN